MKIVRFFLFVSLYFWLTLTEGEMPKKTKFVIPEIPKTFPSRAERDAMIQALDTELQTARSAALKAATLARNLADHRDQVLSARNAASSTRVSPKKRVSA